MFRRERGDNEAKSLGYTTERINLSGGAIDIREYAPRSEGEQQEKHPQVVVGGGWGTTPETYHKFLEELAEERSVLMPDIKHGSSAKVENENGMPDAELRKAAAMIAALEERDVQDGQAVLHSEAGIWGLIAATAAPERIRDVVLVNPAGMLSEESLPRLMVGYSADVVSKVVLGIKNKEIREATLKEFSEGAKVVGGSPSSALHSFREVLAMTNSDIREMIQEVRERGGNVSLLFSHNDKVFPPERVLQELGLDDMDGISTLIDPKATHGEPFLNPKMTAGAIKQILEGFSEK